MNILILFWVLLSLLTSPISFLIVCKIKSPTIKIFFKILAISSLLVLSFFAYFIITFAFEELDYREQVVQNKVTIINDKEKVINCSPKLFRNNIQACLMFIVDHHWDLTDNYKSILLTTNNKKVKLTVKLLGNNNKTYTAKSFGSSNTLLCAFFKPELPKTVKIKQIILKADKPLQIRAIIWRDRDYY